MSSEDEVLGEDSDDEEYVDRISNVSSLSRPRTPRAGSIAAHDLQERLERRRLLGRRLSERARASETPEQTDLRRAANLRSRKSMVQERRSCPEAGH